MFHLMKKVSTVQTWTNFDPWLNGMGMKFVGYIMQKGSLYILLLRSMFKKKEKIYNHTKPYVF
jgi:hypothetical protein